MSIDRTATALLCALVVTAFPATAGATRGENDYGIWFGIAAGLAPLTFVVAAAVHFGLRTWARRTGRREGRYWLTWLGSVVGAALIPLIVEGLRRVQLSVPEAAEAVVLITLFLVPPIAGAFLGFFAWRTPLSGPGAR